MLFSSFDCENPTKTLDPHTFAADFHTINSQYVITTNVPWDWNQCISGTLEVSLLCSYCRHPFHPLSEKLIEVAGREIPFIKCSYRYATLKMLKCVFPDCTRHAIFPLNARYPFWQERSTARTRSSPSSRECAGLISGELNGTANLGPSFQTQP